MHLHLFRFTNTPIVLVAKPKSLVAVAPYVRAVHVLLSGRHAKRSFEENTGEKPTDNCDDDRDDQNERLRSW